MKYNPYSYSKISVYNQCPKKFKYKYIDKVKVPYVYSEPLIKGGCIHSILEYHPDKSPHKHQEKYQYIVDNFLDTDLGREIFMYDGKCEIDFGLTRKLEPCDYYNKEALFRGSVDRMLYNESQNKMILLDYKSGNIPDEKYMSYKQLSWYALYFFIKYPKLENIQISYVYVEHNEKERSLTFSRNNINELKIDLLKNITNIEVTNDFSTNTSSLCEYCEYQEHCESERLSIQNSFLSEL